ncbi:MAG TPA: PKD domain-containing protein, partial [Gemmatimonadales bacterium]|nr:PKD domain-containing protein [Gemmatimonadales bacterium]
ITGHEHTYERFAPMTPNGTADPTAGIREFVVGTGGAGLEALGTIAPNSEVVENSAHGVLRLVLRPTGYQWRFFAEAGQTFSDTGSAPCHGPPGNRPPTASFTSSCSGLTCHFTDATVDPDGSVAAWSWGLGDGATSADQNPGHVYAAGGTYSVSLTVTDDKGTTNSTSQSVTATPPNQPPTAAFTQSCTGLACSFTSTSTDPDGSVAAWSWSFGDGATGTTENPSHTYAAGGTYSVSLTVTDNGGGTGSTSQTVTVAPANTSPTAAFTQSCTGVTCSFTSTSTDPDGTVVGWSWSFGDAATATVANPSHSYAAGGTYTVSLTVTDNSGGTGSTSQSVTVTPPDQPPTAAFTQSCTGLACSFASTSTDPDGSVVAWSWSFGDGATATIENPSHTYAAGGTYTVSITVSDNNGATGTTSQAVTVAPANTSPTAAFTEICTALTCTYASTSTDPDGSVVAWSWTFGDGATATVANPSHTYGAGGTYTVSLTVTDNSGGTGSTSHNVTVTPPNTPPTAALTRSCTGLACSFTSTSTDPDGSVVAWSWSFGDGATATVANPSHTYAAGGTYTVSLTVTDNSAGTGSTSQSVTVSAPNLPPTASFTTACGDLTCSFTSTSTDPDGSVVAWSWSFGDGASATVASPSHTYAAGGTYTVSLTVTDNAGGTNATSQAVPVTAPIGAQVLVGAGDIARCDRTNDEATAALLDGIPGAVFTVGDNVMGGSTAPPDFINCYDPSWGRHKARTRPAIGHMEGFSPGSATYTQYFGAAAGDPGKFYYSYDVGSWHVVVLNSTISTAAGSPQEQWLRADLTAHPAQCALAIWHLPRFSSTSGTGLPVVNDAVKPLWDDLYAAGTEVVINAHYEVYERFAPQTSSGAPDPQLGIRQFTVGTGGIGVNSFKSGAAANSEVRNSGTPGVLKLTLAATSYTWQFIPIAGFGFTDSGSGACH